ncbi:MAG: diiron oxygenase [Janthinobacterium lividum]
MAEAKIETALKNWDSEACVRSRPHKYEIAVGFTLQDTVLDWFPRSRLPFLSRPELGEIAPDLIQLMLAKHLIYFMEYTTKLEHRIVNRAIEVLAHEKFGFDIPSSMKKSALQLYTDEGYHALISYEVSSQVRRLYNLTAMDSEPKRIVDLESMIEDAKPQNKNLLSILIAFVSETIIAKELAILSKESLIPEIYEVLRDHLDDEAKHSKFFSEVFLYFWQNSTYAQRVYIEKSIHPILRVFFTVDNAWLTETLMACGISQNTLSDIIAELGKKQSQNQQIARNAAVTLRVLQKVGIEISLD